MNENAIVDEIIYLYLFETTTLKNANETRKCSGAHIRSRQTSHIRTCGIIEGKSHIKNLLLDMYC